MSENKSIGLQRVGYWWSDKKSKKLNTQLFAQVCRNAGLELVKLDLEKSMEEQGPFVAIVHKLDMLMKAEVGDFKAQAQFKAFEEYARKHPEVAIIDPLPNMKKLLHRYHQYNLVDARELQEKGGAFIPAFVELTTNDVKANVAKMEAAGVIFPCVCKPTLAHGYIAHQMCIVFNEEGLRDITLPCIAQKFINHNAVLYKLFIIADKYYFTERPSLKNFYPGDQKTIYFHSHNISKPNSASILNELDEAEPMTPIVLPEEKRLDQIIRVLNESLGLLLYGVDLIIDNVTGQYAIVDMNIFPGYDEVEDLYQTLCDAILTQIDMRQKGIVKTSVMPTLANAIRPSTSKVASKCRRGKQKEVCASVIPYPRKCFCCPITGVCDSGFEQPAPTHRHFELSDRLTDALHDLPDREGQLKLYRKNSICSPEDSGIETSDSCDEKKKATVLKQGKRQHSRNHASLQEDM